LHETTARESLVVINTSCKSGTADSGRASLSLTVTDSVSPSTYLGD
jgi:hypothetical protein